MNAIDELARYPDALVALAVQQLARKSFSLTVNKAVAEKRFTSGALYNSFDESNPDLQDEFVDREELQESIWTWMRRGDRRVFDSHDVTKQIGEVVELAVLPFDVAWKVSLPGEPDRELSLQAGAPIVGIVWEPSAWEDVKNGRIRGYSWGGWRSA